MMDRSTGRGDPATPVPSDVRAGAPSDNTTLTAVLAEYERHGYDASFGARDGALLHCSVCRQETPVGEFDVAETRRLEGASDPDAASIVVVGTCPRCGARGTVVLAYGPEAGEVDADVLAHLDLGER